jgi:hypothetical protein
MTLINRGFSVCVLRCTCIARNWPARFVITSRKPQASIILLAKICWDAPVDEGPQKRGGARHSTCLCAVCFDVYFVGIACNCPKTIMATEDSPSPEILYPTWQHEYQAALIELDREKLKGRVAAAEAAIYKRLQQLSQSSDDFAERRVIEDALHSLRVLKRDELKYPDWEK